MKRIVKSVAIVVLSISSFAVAQAQKVAHISVDSLISIMPESKTAEGLVVKHQKELETQVGSMQTELQSKYEKYMAEGSTYSEIIKASKEKELQDLKNRVDEFTAQARQDLQNKQQELSRPIYEKARKAIELVAKENGYKYVLDTSTGVVIYSEPTEDILQLVKKKLETMPAAVIPGANNVVKPTPAPKAAPKAPGK
ncbi:MAG: OmpH family outer membrane protein [Bacteroidia bacterium]|jgi:outer membrane protein|nr:OmpH family outer membrane protein [Bacteroidia bacterium]